MRESHITFVFLCLSLLFGSLSDSAEKTHKTVIPKGNLQPFLTKYCIRCHGPDEQNGQVRFDHVVWEISTNDQAQHWQDVLDILNAGNMPPEDEKQPTTAELSATLETMTDFLVTARKRLTDHGGEISMRRLNRREYVNTIHELFGFYIPIDKLPEDGEFSVFDTVGAEQLFTSAHFEKYLELGREIAAQGFEWAGKPRLSPTVARTQPEKRVTENLRVKLADLDLKMKMKNEGKTWKEMGFKDEGEMEIIFRQFDSRAGKPRRYLQYPLVDQGIYFVDANNETKRFGANRGGSDPRGIYKFRVRAGVVGSPPEIRTFFRVTDKVGTVGVMKVRGTESDPEIIELSYRPKVGQRTVNLAVEENRANIRVLDGYLNRIDRGGQWAAIWMDWLEIEGPFYEQNRAFFEKLVSPKPPINKIRSSNAWNDENARQFIEQIAFQAFRKKTPKPEYVDHLLKLFQANRKQGHSFETGMSEVIAVILASPQFLFLQEAGLTDRSDRRQLDNRELAIRLSYFLWSSPPDEELYRTAEEGLLGKPDVFRSQVERMLNDSRASAFVEGFMSQWADLERFDAITVDEQKNFLFNKGIRYSAKKEVIEFFRTLLDENLPASHLTSSDFVVINGLLGTHYGISEADSDKFQKVTLPEDSPRGGLLGQTAILTLGSNGERSSPVIRGAYVMEKLLHDKPAPPPPNVPELGAATDKPATNREMVLLHQKQAVCASCHKKMDVIGFGLENFDAIGKWRDSEMVNRKSIPIEPAGTLPNGSQFASVQELKSLLLDENDRLAEELVKSMMSYGLGRTIEFSDADEIDRIVESLKSDDYRIRSMVYQITQSKLFRTK